VPKVTPPEYDAYLAVGTCGGSVLFDSTPSQADVYNATEDLTMPITVYHLRLTEKAREALYMLEDEE
jgi:hypothetical protein